MLLDQRLPEGYRYSVAAFKETPLQVGRTPINADWETEQYLNKKAFQNFFALSAAGLKKFNRFVEYVSQDLVFLVQKR